PSPSSYCMPCSASPPVLPSFPTRRSSDLICPQDKPAGIVDQGNHINAALSAVRSLQPGTGTGIAAPYFINMRPLVTAHILIVRQTLLEDELVDETADRRF